MRATCQLLAIALLCGWGCGGTGKGGEVVVEANMEVLMDPTHATMSEKAPDNFRARFQTSKGDFVIEIDRASAPHGVDRFYNLVQIGFFNEQRFFRVVPGFIVQFGMHGDPQVTGKWTNATITDDPVKGSNDRGTLTYAKPGSGTDNRTTQLFINLKHNAFLDDQEFAPFGKIVEGIEVVDAITAEYGEKPNQQQIGKKGNQYLNKLFPNLDYIKTISID